MDIPENISDEKIIRLVQGTAAERERGAACLYGKHRDKFIARGKKVYSLRPDEAETAYNDAVTAAVKKIADGKFERRASLQTFLSNIHNNECVNQIRKNAAKKEKPNNNYSDLDPLAEFLAEHPESTERVEEQMTAVELVWPKLKPKCEKMLMLQALGKSDREIADILGEYANADVVKVIRRRCRKELQELCNVSK